MEYTYDENILSDLHKDAYGFRPSPEFSILWQCSSDDQKQEIWDDLIATLQRSIAVEEEREDFAVKSFEAQVEASIQAGASDRETAIRWIVESLELSESELTYGAEYVCFKLGLPYSYATHFEATVSF
jgi:hypothetical protein